MKKRSSILSLMTFEVRGMWFGIPLKVVEGVAPLHEVTAIPGASSRVIHGLTYTQGKIMTVLDVAPLVNKKPVTEATDSVVLQFQEAYYAIPVTSVGTIVSDPKLKRVSNTFKGVIASKCVHEKKEIFILGVDTIIANHVPCE